MATPSLVPRDNNEGGIGTSDKRWAQGHFQTLEVGGVPVTGGGGGSGNVDGGSPAASTSKIQARRGTSTQWQAANPVLALGEIGYETDTREFKVGDGATHWQTLAYVSAAFASYAYSSANEANTFFSDAGWGAPSFDGSELYNLSVDAHAIFNWTAASIGQAYAGGYELDTVIEGLFNGSTLVAAAATASSATYAESTLNDPNTFFSYNWGEPFIPNGGQIAGLDAGNIVLDTWQNASIGQANPGYNGYNLSTIFNNLFQNVGGNAAFTVSNAISARNASQTNTVAQDFFQNGWGAPNFDGSNIYNIHASSTTNAERADHADHSSAASIPADQFFASAGWGQPAFDATNLLNVGDANISKLGESLNDWFNNNLSSDGNSVYAADHAANSSVPADQFFNSWGLPSFDATNLVSSDGHSFNEIKNAIFEMESESNQIPSSLSDYWSYQPANTAANHPTFYAGNLDVRDANIDGFDGNLNSALGRLSTNANNLLNTLGNDPAQIVNFYSASLGQYITLLNANTLYGYISQNVDFSQANFGNVSGVNLEGANFYSASIGQGYVGGGGSGTLDSVLDNLNNAISSINTSNFTTSGGIRFGSAEGLLFGGNDFNVQKLLTTSDPHNAGQLWNNNGIVHVSNG